MISLEFGDHGETLLLFLENEQSLQVYQYRGNNIRKLLCIYTEYKEYLLQASKDLRFVHL